MIGHLKEKSEFELGETPVCEINEDGNVCQRNSKLHLEKNGIQLTRDYWNIIELWDDQYIICDLGVSGCYLEDIDEYNIDTIISFNPQIKIKFRFGVIKLQRDKNGDVIPFSESTIVPVIYDGIAENNEASLTACSNGKYTYIDLNPESLNYGQQIVPAVLEHAVPFNVGYDGFAQCSIDGVVGYLPRNCNPRETLESSDLLTKEQVQYLLKTDYDLAVSSNDKLLELTGFAKVLKPNRK